MSTAALHGPASTRPDVPLTDVVRAAWTRHRTTLLVASALVAALALVVELFAHAAPLSTSGLGQLVQLVDRAVLLVGVVIAAPLVAREYEHGTRVWAWSQDVSPARWLTGTCVLLAGFAVVWALVLGLAAQDLVPGRLLAEDFAFGTVFFGASPLVQIGHVVLALALGVLVGVLVRRTVAAMGLTLVASVVVALAVPLLVRPHYLPPVRAVAPVGVVALPTRGLEVERGFLDAAGRAVGLPDACRTGPPAGCLERGGVVASFSEYQPVDRLLALRLVETGLYLAAALVLIGITLLVLRRVGRR